MKRVWGIIVSICACCVLVFSLAGCGGQEQPKSEVGTMETNGSQTVASTEPFYVLVVGNDTRIGTMEINKPQYADGNARSDVMMLLRVDPKTYQVAIVTVPRDTATTINGQTVKINEGYAQGGMNGAVEQVESLTGVDIKYYFNMTFVQFEDFITNMDGVTADVPIDMSLVDIVHGDKVSLTKGDSQQLNNEEALVLARQRKQYADDLDACRQIQDRQIVQSLITKVASRPSDEASTYASILTTGCETNMSADELTEYLTMFMDNASSLSFKSGTGPYKGGIDAATQLWLAPRDEKTWAKVIATIEAGGDPTTVVALPRVAAAN